MKKHVLLAAAAIVACTAAPLLSFAQVQRFPGVIDKGTDAKLPAERELKKEQGAPLQEAPKPQTPKDSHQKVLELKGLTFKGNTIFSEEELTELLNSYIGKNITNADLAQMKYEITKAYFDKGYLLVKVITPPQSVSAGIIHMDIYEAKIGKVIVEENNVVKPYIAEAHTRKAKPGDVFREQNVESMVNDEDYLENVKAAVILRPGTAFNTTDLALRLREAKEDINHIAVNNYGSDLTGRAGARLHLEKSNLLQRGEKFEGTFSHSKDDIWAADLLAKIPTGWYNTKLELQYTQSDYDIAGRLAALGASGQTQRGRISLSSNILNMRQHQLTLRGGLEARHHESATFASSPESEDDIRQVFGQAAYLHRGLDKIIYASLTATQGIKAFGASEKGDPLNTRTQGDPQAFILSPVVIANIRSPFSEGTFKSIVTGQMTSNTLLSSDLFTIGGYNSVRGFRVAQEAGEAGYQYNVEYMHDIPVNLINWSFSAGPFTDGGAVFNRIDGSSTDSHLYSAGFGAEAIGNVFDIGETKIRFDVARTLGSYDSPQVENAFAYFEVQQNF